MKFPSIRCHGNASAFPLYVFVLARLRARALLPRVNLQWRMSHQDASSSPMLDICVLKPHECDEHPCTAAAAFALLPVQACLVCRQCPHVSSFFLYFAFCKRCGELLDSGGAHPAGFPNRKGNAFSSGRSSGATPKSSVCIPAKHTSSCTRVSGAGESTGLPFQLPGPGQTLP